MNLEVFYLICGYEMVLDLGFLEKGDSELLCLVVVGDVTGVGVWVYWCCCWIWVC